MTDTDKPLAERLADALERRVPVFEGAPILDVAPNELRRLALIEQEHGSIASDYGSVKAAADAMEAEHDALRAEVEALRAALNAARGKA